MKIAVIKKTIIGSLLFFALSLCACKTVSDVESISKSGLFFDTVVTVTVYAPNKDKAELLADDCMDICSHYESLFNKNIATSDIAKINSSSGKSVNVDHDTALLIEEALDYSKKTGGKFDITINPVSVLWNFHEGLEHIPEKSELEKALSLVDHNKLTADTVNNTVTLSIPGGSIDPGGVAKGFIADKIADYLYEQKITGAIINMGGDIRLVGTKNGNDGFILALTLKDTSVATSGIYERALDSGGKRYHHIFDTKTGYSVDTDIESVTVITDRAVDADCLCTVCILEGYEKAAAYIESIPGTEAIFILTDKSVKITSGAEKCIRY